MNYFFGVIGVPLNHHHPTDLASLATAQNHSASNCKLKPYVEVGKKYTYIVYMYIYINVLHMLAVERNYFEKPKDIQ